MLERFTGDARGVVTGARALSTWRISSCSVRRLSAATARSPTSGSLLAAFSASSSVASMPVSIC